MQRLITTLHFYLSPAAQRMAIGKVQKALHETW